MLSIKSLKTELMNLIQSSKIDNNFHNIIKIQTTLTKMQKDISDLRTDIDVVYDLEIDSRKKIKALQ